MAKKKSISHKKRKKDTVKKEEGNAFLDIDQDALDVEWLNQSRDYFEWATHLAESRHQLDQAKLTRDIVKADLSKCIRENPADFELEKVTESQVTNAILLQDEYQDAESKVHECSYAVRLAEAAVQAMDHRRKALENLVFLHGQNYFSEPRAIGEESSEYVATASKRRARKRTTK